MKTKIRRLVAVNLALLGLAAGLTPATAFARCPAYGQTTIIGSCAPRQTCYKRVVDFVAVGLHYQYSMYRSTNNFGWVYMYSSDPIPC